MVDPRGRDEHLYIPPAGSLRVLESSPKHAFWGKNYDRLLSIKRNLDPDDVLWCFPCVGSERWQQQDDGHLCRVK